MKNIDHELVDWAINKIKTDYQDDVALLIGQVGGGKIPTDEQNMVFDYFIPITDRGYQLAQTFIIEDMGYDLYPISWERLENIANIEEPRMIFAFAKGEVIYAKEESYKLRFETLKREMLLKLQDRAFQIPKCIEYLETAQEIFQTMLFEEDLCNVRKAAGGVCSYLMNAIALINGTFLESGYMNFTRDLHNMKEYPASFEKAFLEMLAQNEVDDIREKVFELITMTRNFLLEKIDLPEQETFEPNYEDLAMWYQEMRYTFRRVEYFTSIKSAEDSYLLGCYLQIEFDAIKDDFCLQKMDLLSVFDQNDLSEFAKRAKEIEHYIVTVLEEHQVTINKYQSMEEFAKKN